MTAVSNLGSERSCLAGILRFRFPFRCLFSNIFMFTYNNALLSRETCSARRKCSPDPIFYVEFEFDVGASVSGRNRQRGRRYRRCRPVSASHYDTNDMTSSKCETYCTWVIFRGEFEFAVGESVSLRNRQRDRRCRPAPTAQQRHMVVLLKSVRRMSLG